MAPRSVTSATSSRGAKIGRKCIAGQASHVAADVPVGNIFKVQSNFPSYTGTVIEDDVFLGPSSVLTSVANSRSQVNRHSLYEKTLLQRGCSIGANATIVCGVTIGRYGFVGAGAVVTNDVLDCALTLGVAARQMARISRHGQTLREPDPAETYVCPEGGRRYQAAEQGVSRCLDLDEEEALPIMIADGDKSYGQWKALGPKERVRS